MYSCGFNLMEYAVNQSNEADGIFCAETLVYEMVKIFGIKHIPLIDLRHTPFRQNMIR